MNEFLKYFDAEGIFIRKQSHKFEHFTVAVRVVVNLNPQRQQYNKLIDTPKASLPLNKLAWSNKAKRNTPKKYALINEFLYVR